MRTKKKVQKKSPEVTPTPSPEASAGYGSFTLSELLLDADLMINAGHTYAADMAAREWTPVMTEEVSHDFQAFKAARAAWLTERDLRKQSTVAYEAEVQVARTFREGLIASLRFIGEQQPALLNDPRLAGEARQPQRLLRWLNEATSLVSQYERELVACRFATYPAAELEAQVSALGTANAVQAQNQRNLPALAQTQLAARAKLEASMERLRRAGLMTFVGNKAVQKEFRKNVQRRRKAKATPASPAEVAAPASAAESVAKPAPSPAPDAARPAS